ncbi:MAG: hypothetical protein UZ17_ACD001001211 [Acidobacteria bacterium OLB17]|nr:MAG: hypothetical protein UZ17_ACD001001211 [Acidobacteria bacterium OLB17]
MQKGQWEDPIRVTRHWPFYFFLRKTYLGVSRFFFQDSRR